MIRLIYALQFELVTADGTLRSLIAWLKPDGNSPTVKPLDKPRVIDLRVGDLFEHVDLGIRKIKAIETFRERTISETQYEKFNDEGFAVKVNT